METKILAESGVKMAAEKKGILYKNCWLGLLCYELQTFLSTSILRIGELLRFAFCILNKRFFFFQVSTLSPHQPFNFSPFFKIYLLLLRWKKKRKKKRNQSNAFYVSFFYNLKIINSYIFISAEMSSRPKLQVLGWVVCVKEISVLWLTICLIQ